MSNGEVCCILGVCCPAAAREQKISQALQTDLGCDSKEADEVAAWFNERFDFAPKGTLDPLVSAVADMARKHPEQS